MQFALHSGNAATWRFWPSKKQVEIGSHEFPFPLASGRFPQDDFLEAMEEPCRADVSAQMKETSENSLIDIEFQTKELPGCWYRLSARLQGNILSKEVVWVGVLIDITKTKQLEVDLKAEALTAKEASKAKSEFLAMMSHEIRTPLNGLVGFCDLLAKEKLEGDSQDYVRNIQVCSDSLLSVINNVLNFSKLEAGKFQVSPVRTSLHDLLDEMTLLFSDQAEKKGLVFKLINSAPEFLETDGACLRQVLINLIGNSLKLTAKGSIELVCVRVAQ